MDTPYFKNPRIFRLIKRIVFCLLLLLFFTTSFIIHALQLINYILFKKIFPDFRRWINNYLQNVIQSSFIYVFEWQCPVSFRVSFESTETMNLFCAGENGFLIVNHAYPLDAFFYHVFGEMTNSLNAIKGFAKSSLKYMPILGWMIWFNDSIFLERNWQADEQTIKEKLEKLKRSKMPYKILIAPEGTRFTAEKYRISQEFIKKHDIKVNLKYHLLPRVKGFAATLRLMQEKKDPHFALYNVEFLSQVDEKYAEPTLENFLKGKPFRGDCFVGRIPESAIPEPGSDDLKYAEFLYSIFEYKDKMVEEHHKYHRFPNSVIKVRHHSGWRTLKFLLFNVILTGSLLAYGLYWAFVLQSFALKLAIFSYIVVTFSVILMTFSMSEVSSYGTESK